VKPLFFVASLLNHSEFSKKWIPDVRHVMYSVNR